MAERSEGRLECAVGERDLSQLPSIDKVLADPRLERFSRRAAVAGARAAVEEARNGLDPGSIASRAEEVASALDRPAFRAAINCTGTILNTGLGRARLPMAAIEAIERVGSSHSSLEIDLETGRRGNRQTPLQSLLTELTGSESAYVVNNNAGAVLLAISTFAAGGSVLLSRGQSVEIGGAFRMPDVVRAAGARLIDVGCTNRTRIADYESAIETDTRVILRCHPSNFKVTGFVEEPSVQDMANLANTHDLVLIDDVGSGCLFETTSLRLPHEPTLAEAIKSGAHVVTASGDKLIGGPQAGILLGDKSRIAEISKNPLARALRIDKLTAAGLEATLRLWADDLRDEIPTYWALSRPVEELQMMGDAIIAELGTGTVSDGVCEPGGGSLPGVTIPSMRVTFDVADPESFAKSLRQGDPPVIGYIEKGRFWLDLRCIDDNDYDDLLGALKKALA